MRQQFGHLGGLILRMFFFREKNLPIGKPVQNIKILQLNRLSK
jgi:hypothetical protein